MIYLIITESKEHCKIGYSQNPKERLSHLQTANPTPLVLSHVIDGDIDLEKKIHKNFSHLKINSEWFKYDTSILDYFQNTTSTGKDFIKKMRFKMDRRMELRITDELYDEIIEFCKNNSLSPSAGIRFLIKSRLDDLANGGSPSD